MHDPSLIDYLYLQHPELVRLCRELAAYCHTHRVPPQAVIHGVAWDFDAARRASTVDAVSNTRIDLHGQPCFNQPYEG